MDKILELNNVGFSYDQGKHWAIAGVTLTLHLDQDLGVMGESGAGKSTLFKGLLQLESCWPQGEAYFYHENKRIPLIVEGFLRPKAMNARALYRLRGLAVNYFDQEALSALTPHYSIGAQVFDMAWLYHGQIQGGQARARATTLLQEVHLQESLWRAKKHQLSGGQVQRAMIATAMVCPTPSLLVADEPTTKTDLILQREVVQLFNSMRAKIAHPNSLVFITHDLAILNQVLRQGSRLLVLLCGAVMESFIGVQKRPDGQLTLISAQQHHHPYTTALLKAYMEYQPPEVFSPTSTQAVESSPGCRYAPHCPWLNEMERRASGFGQLPLLCRRAAPPLFLVGSPGKDEQRIACHLFAPGHAGLLANLLGIGRGAPVCAPAVEQTRRRIGADTQVCPYDGEKR